MSTHSWLHEWTVKCTRQHFVPMRIQSLDFTCFLPDIFCCFHSIHNYHSLDHEFVIKSTHFGHFLFLSVIQKVLKWKLEEWLLFAFDYAKYVYRNAKIYNENKDYEWITLNVGMHDYVSKWKIPLYYLSIDSLKFAERHFNMTLNMNSKLPDFSFW